MIRGTAAARALRSTRWFQQSPSPRTYHAPRERRERMRHAQTMALRLLLRLLEASLLIARTQAALPLPVEQCSSAQGLVHGARKLCSGSSVSKVLQAIGVASSPGGGGDEVPTARQVIEKHGFRAAIDLRLLQPGSEEADELMAELQARGVSIADRSKIRLLFGERDEHVGDDSPWRGAGGPSVGDAASRTDGRLWRQPRRLQHSIEGGDSPDEAGLSLDTIAIVLSVLVGAAGCALLRVPSVTCCLCNCNVVQAYTARQAEHSANALSRELNVAEQTREREHEQMLEQISRINRWLDECCRPIKLAWHCMACERRRFIAASVVELESSAPEAVARMLEIKSSRWGLTEDGAKAIDFKNNNYVWWDKDARASELTDVYDSVGQAYNSAAAGVVALTDVSTVLSKPYGRILPAAILEYLSADPTTSLAQQYRLFARHSWVRETQRLAGLLQAHAAMVEMPPTEWLKATYPGEHWRYLDPALFLHWWLGYTRAWASVLAEWDAGEFRCVEPRGNATFPFEGMRGVNEWAIRRGEARQRELVGMTAQAELPVDTFAHIVQST